MKILHVISSGGFFGAENVLLNLAESFEKKGNEVIVCAFNDLRNPHTEIVDKAKSMGLMTITLDSKGRFDFSLIKKLQDVLIGNNIDIIHTHNYKSNIIGALAVKKLNIPIVSTAHGFTDATTRISVYELLDRFFLKHYFNGVAVMSQKMLPRIDENKKKVIPNGINVFNYKTYSEMRNQVRNKYHINNDEFLVGTIGRLSKEKNQAYLLKAICKVIEKNSNVKVLVVGDGPQLGHLRKTAEKLGLADRIVFTGIIKDIIPVYQALDIFVLPSLTEGVPMTILEAMASKVPVIATNVGGVPDIIKSEEIGVLCDVNHIEQLSDAIAVLINDNAKREFLKNYAWNYVNDHYSLEKMYEAYDELYKKAMNK